MHLLPPSLLVILEDLLILRPMPFPVTVPLTLAALAHYVYVLWALQSITKDVFSALRKTSAVHYDLAALCITVFFVINLLNFNWAP